MLPNVRLMIAATLASVVALICGFGLFAVFRVSHEPFVRSPAGTASLQLVADNAAYSPVGFASSVPFERHLQVDAEPSAAVPTDMPAPMGEREAETEAALAPEPIAAATEAAPAPEPSAAVPEQASSGTAEATEQPAAAAAPTSEMPAAGAESTSANDAANIAASSAPESTFATTANGAGEAAPSPNTPAAASDQDAKPTVVSIADAWPAFSTAAVAVNEQHDAQPTLRERLTPSSAPADDAGPRSQREHKTAAKKPKRMRAVVRIRRVPRAATFQYASTQFAQTQYATTEQYFGAAQANFPMAAPSQAQYFAWPAASVRYVRLVAGKPKAPSKEPNTAIGGPFVNATSR